MIMQILKDLCLKYVFLGGVSFFWFLIRCYHWAEYCPAFFCDPYKNVANEYDFIVVGAGTAGSVLALRLAEIKNASILLIEAGPTGGPILDIPAALPLLQLSPLDWGHKTVPQKHSNFAMRDHGCNWPRGKLVGGSGRFNNMIYLRGHPLDFKDWYKNKSDFNYERDILDYFKKAENHQGVHRNDVDYHGKDGPLFVEDLPFLTDLSNAILEAAKHLGLPVRNLNGKHNTGFMKPQANLKNGSRYSTGHYLLDHRSDNLHISTNTLALKLLVHNNFEVYAVKTAKFGATKTIRAKKGVILSAGTVETPKLLLLSGIGPKDHLKELGINQIKDLPVGENLQDHVTTGVDLVTLKEPLDLNPSSLLSPFTIMNYVTSGKGPWTTIQCEAIGVLHTACFGAKNFDECTEKQADSPDLQFMVLPMGFVSDNGAHLREIIGLKNEIWDNYVAPLVGSPTIAILPILLHPKSRGYVRLADKNPDSKPIINPNYLSHPYDIDVILKGIQIMRKFLDTPSMQKLGAKIYEKKIPGCENYQFNSREYWECYVRHITLTVYHPVGTAKMGHSDDKSSVVDYDFKVLGINKLYVADASVMPNLPSANTNAATVLVAEKAADSIKYQDFLSSGFSRKEFFSAISFTTIVP